MPIFDPERSDVSTNLPARPESGVGPCGLEEENTGTQTPVLAVALGGDYTPVFIASASASELAGEADVMEAKEVSKLSAVRRLWERMATLPSDTIPSTEQTQSELFDQDAAVAGGTVQNHLPAPWGPPAPAVLHTEHASQPIDPGFPPPALGAESYTTYPRPTRRSVRQFLHDTVWALDETNQHQPAPSEDGNMELGLVDVHGMPAVVQFEEGLTSEAMLVSVDPEQQILGPSGPVLFGEMLPSLLAEAQGRAEAFVATRFLDPQGDIVAKKWVQVVSNDIRGAMAERHQRANAPEILPDRKGRKSAEKDAFLMESAEGRTQILSEEMRAAVEANIISDDRDYNFGVFRQEFGVSQHDGVRITDLSGELVAFAVTPEVAQRVHERGKLSRYSRSTGITDDPRNTFVDIVALQESHAQTNGGEANAVIDAEIVEENTGDQPARPRVAVNSTYLFGVSQANPHKNGLIVHLRDALDAVPVPDDRMLPILGKDLVVVEALEIPPHTTHFLQGIINEDHMAQYSSADGRRILGFALQTGMRADFQEEHAERRRYAGRGVPAAFAPLVMESTVVRGEIAGGTHNETASDRSADI